MASMKAGGLFAAAVAADARDEDADIIFQFTADYPLAFPLPLNPSETVGTPPARGLPSTFAVDSEERFVYRAVDGGEWDGPKLLKPVVALASS